MDSYGVFNAYWGLETFGNPGKIINTVGIQNPDFEWSTLSCFGMVHKQDIPKLLAWTVLYIKTFFSLYIKWSRLMDHSKNGHFSPIFEWL